VRPLVVAALSVALCSAARADGTRVRATTTVEVLDDKAQIDDVISRLKKEQSSPRAGEGDKPTDDLKRDRGVSATDPSRAEAGKRREGDRRPARERERPERVDRQRRRP
jgi:hypothetical protein